MATVLILEDEPIVIDVMTRALEREGYSVIRAATIADAVQISAGYRGRIDLLISNSHFKDGNGREAVRSIRRLRPKLKVLHISGYTEDVVREAGGISDGASFLQMPFRPQTLIARVRETLGTSA